MLEPSPAKQPVKMVAICADDFGIDAQVDRAIVDLALRRRLTGASVLVDAPINQQEAEQLLEAGIDIGLHLNLTERLGQMPEDAVMPLRGLILRAYSGQISRLWAAQMIERQLDRFETLFHRPPDYVDGHLHVHQLPVIAPQLIQALGSRSLPGGFWLRDTRAGALAGSPWPERFKAWVIGHLGMAKLAQRAHAAHWLTNRGFYGVYDFSGQHRPFAVMLQQWLTQAQTGAVVMTHPALASVSGDPMAQVRVKEYEELAGESFGQWLDAQGISLRRASQVLSSLP